MRTKIEQKGLDLYNSLREPLSKMETMEEMDNFKIELGTNKEVIAECMKCAQINIESGKFMKRSGIDMNWDWEVINHYNNLIIEACNAVNKEDNEMESKREVLNNMTVKELRAEAKAHGIEGMSRAKKEALIEAIMNAAEARPAFTATVSKVNMYAFTGMFIGEFDAEVQDGKILVSTSSRGELMFDLNTGKEICEESKTRWANKVEAV